jgi:hypothetical protein
MDQVVSQTSPHAAHRPAGVRSVNRPHAGQTWSTQQAGSPPSGSGWRGSSGSMTGQSSSGGAKRASASTAGQV